MVQHSALLENSDSTAQLKTREAAPGVRAALGVHPRRRRLAAQVGVPVRPELQRVRERDELHVHARQRLQLTAVACEGHDCASTGLIFSWLRWC